MKNMPTRFMVTLAALLLALGCGGGDADAEQTTGDETAGGEEAHHGEHGHAEHGGEADPGHSHSMSAEMESFHDVFAPIWHSEDGNEARAAQACAQLGQLESLGMPAAESAGDETITGEMRAAIDGLTNEGCAGDAPAVEAVDTHLEAMHDAFHHAMESWQAANAE